MQYVVVFEQTPNNWAAYVPDLPGCVATGKTRVEVEGLIRDGIIYHIEALREYNEPVPQPGVWTGVVDVQVESQPKARRAERMGRADR